MPKYQKNVLSHGWKLAPHLILVSLIGPQPTINKCHLTCAHKLTMKNNLIMVNMILGQFQFERPGVAGREGFWKCVGKGVNTLFKCICRLVYNKSKCGSREGEMIRPLFKWVGLFKQDQKSYKNYLNCWKWWKWHSWTCRKYTEGKNQTSNSIQLVIGPFGAGQLCFNQTCSSFQNISLHAFASGPILQVSTQNLNDIHAF